ncbi:MAG TPA: peptidylprolyl isomerase [Polyangiaceae bacterium]|jgi:peptidyl-prolyl cis-trans isomerase A (cyclophilin A)|nr:peptidylprolyl isomerase [Polyangiaceae bacterium]
MRSFIVVVLGLALSACEKEPPPPSPPSAEPPPPPPPKASAPSPSLPPLLDPKQAKAEAPASYKAKLVTTKGDIVIEVTRAWAPRAADRFYNLVKLGYYNEQAFFRVVKDFVVQFGMHGDPKVTAAWREAYISDEMVKESNKKGTVTFAKRGPDTRTVQIFINLKDNPDLDEDGFAAFGKVIAGMDVIAKLYSDYGEEPKQPLILEKGNTYLKEQFPKLDYINTATIVE